MSRGKEKRSEKSDLFREILTDPLKSEAAEPMPDSDK